MRADVAPASRHGMLRDRHVVIGIEPVTAVHFYATIELASHQIDREDTKNEIEKKAHKRDVAHRRYGLKECIDDHLQAIDVVLAGLPVRSPQKIMSTRPSRLWIERACWRPPAGQFFTFSRCIGKVTPKLFFFSMKNSTVPLRAWMNIHPLPVWIERAC